MSRGTAELLTSVRETRQQLALSQHRDRAVADCIVRLEDLEQRLARLPRVAILGEFNSGKTSLANLLLGACVLPTSVVANTRVPVVLRYAPTAAIFAFTQNGRHAINTPAEIDVLGDIPLRVEVHLPVDALRRFEIVDTPAGTTGEPIGAPGQVHVWCTVATRAWTDSERRAWSALPKRVRDNGLLVATHKDGLRCADDVEKVGERLRMLAGPLFSDVFFVTAEEAAVAEAERRDMTGVEELVAHIDELTTAVSERRRHKAGVIVRRLVRRTLQAMAANELGAGATALLVKWKQTASRLTADADATNPHAAAEKLLKAFAEFTEGTAATWINDRAQAGSRKKAWNLRLPDMGQLLSLSWRPPSEAGGEFVRDLADDLTAVLRIELVEATLKSPAPRGLYRKAQSALLSLAAAAAGTPDGSLRARLERTDVAAPVPPALPSPPPGRLEPPPLPVTFRSLDPVVPPAVAPRSGADPGAIRARAS